MDGNERKGREIGERGWKDEEVTGVGGTNLSGSIFRRVASLKFLYIYIYMYLFTNKGPGDLIAIEFIPTGQAVPARGYTRHTENFTLFHLTGREEGGKKLRSFHPTLPLIAAYLTLFTR